MPTPRGELTGEEREVALLLEQLAPLTAPTDTEWQRMRSRVLAAAGGHTPTRSPDPVPRRPASPRPAGRRRSATPARPTATVRGRFAIAAVAALALLFSLTGMSLFLSRDALPGDALYGIKRTAEAASLGLIFGDEPKALKHLEFAAARVTEIETLTQRYPNPADGPVGGYLSALTDLDTDALAGGRQLLALGVRNDPRLLDSLHAWAVQQHDRLAAVGPRLPSPVLEHQQSTMTMLNSLGTRSDALMSRAQCYEFTANADDLGPLPATGVCHIKPTATSSTPGGQAPAPTGGQQPGVTLPRNPQATPPQPGVTTQPVPATSAPTGGPTGGPLPTEVSTPATINVPLPLPSLSVPPLLPGLPALTIG